MSYNAKNYTEQGGERTVIGGELVIDETGQLSFNGKILSPADTQPQSSAADLTALLADFNALLIKLKTAGLMKND